MITKEQFINGLVAYVDQEVLPHMSTAEKWIAGTAITLAVHKSEEILNALMTNSAIKALGLVSAEGLIDIDLLADALKVQAAKYGKMTINLPLLSPMTFSAEDIDRARECMR